ncbi:MAG TPA: Xaa-Pro peptidase family protein [Vicinamibacterales bacterium]|jgi:Xaa-Pro aminopeptidase|nr:Xaa-Pro peptidase family protein [Vicinamibacterales bacterium]
MSHAPSQALETRHQTVRAFLAEQGLDALVVTALPNILYLTNFTGSSAIVVLTTTSLHFITDFRYVAAISETRGTAIECPGLDLVTVESAYDTTLANVLTGLGRARVGFEAAHLSVSRHQWLVKTLTNGPALLATEGIVERARVRKDSYELDTLREAARRLSSVANVVFDDVRPGKTERDVAMSIDWRIREAGFERSAFETIVAAGANAALPHAKPGERKLVEGDLVVLDFGGVYDSYCVDLTRTVVLGRASDRARKVYQAVLEAHDRAVAAVKPGVTRFDIDGAARQSLIAAGFGEAFGHGTGHGLGIEVHEEPRISRRRPGVDRAEADPSADDQVAPGMVFTIEPGAYFPGWSGVRIEDDVLVTESGVEMLTHVPTDLMEL